jgi:hypothetical protein
VLGITYNIGNDGDENVELTAGQPRASFLGMFNKIGRDVNALARR